MIHFGRMPVVALAGEHLPRRVWGVNSIVDVTSIHPRFGFAVPNDKLGRHTATSTQTVALPTAMVH